MLESLPYFDTNQFCAALLKLGFKEQKRANHGRKFKHQHINPINTPRPYLLVPNGLKKDKNFQKALAKSLIVSWGYSENDILKALK